MTEKIPVRIASGLLNSLKGGVVPRVGLPYISVGRKDEINSLLADIETIKAGGGTCRFVVGRYGSGKSFLLQMMKSYALDSGFVVVDADLSPSRRFYGNHNQGLATYKELIKNMATKTKPEGGALNLLLQKWLNNLQIQVMEEHSITKEDKDFNKFMEIKIYKIVDILQENVNGFDFAKVLLMYYKAYMNDDQDTMQSVLKFMRGEYRLKTEAKQELGISNIITDSNWYDYLKLFAAFVVNAGYTGLLVLIDELVNIYKIPHSVTRQQNYEMILMMYNDTLQGKAKHIGFIMGGTPECIEDNRRGLFSYEALKSRLKSSRFTNDDIRDILAPIITLKPLNYEEMLILLEKLAIIHAKLNNYKVRLETNQIAEFIKIEYSRVGTSSYITPREVIRDFIEILNILYQYPNKTIKEIIQNDKFEFATSVESPDDEFAEFEL